MKTWLEQFDGLSAVFTPDLLWVEIEKIGKCRVIWNELGSVRWIEAEGEAQRKYQEVLTGMGKQFVGNPRIPLTDRQKYDLERESSRQMAAKLGYL